MVKDGVLPEKEIIGWRAADGEAFPTANTGEIVVFESFFYRGFSVPTSRFFRGLLHFYNRAPFCPFSLSFSSNDPAEIRAGRGRRCVDSNEETTVRQVCYPSYEGLLEGLALQVVLHLQP